MDILVYYNSKPDDGGKTVKKRSSAIQKNQNQHDGDIIVVIIIVMDRDRCIGNSVVAPLALYVCDMSIKLEMFS